MIRGGRPTNCVKCKLLPASSVADFPGTRSMRHLTPTRVLRTPSPRTTDGKAEDKATSMTIPD